MIDLKKYQYVDKSVRRIKQTYKSFQSLGLINFIKHALYIKQETLLLTKDLGEISSYEKRNKLTIYSIDDNTKNELVKLYNLADISISNPEKLIENYLNDDCKCFFATKNDKMIGFLWWGDKQTDTKHCLPILRYIQKRFLTKNDDAFGIDFFILPEERGDGVALEFYSKVCRTLNDLGYKTIFGTVLSDNRPARWTYNLLGLTVIKKITIHRLLIYKTFISATDV